MTLDRQLSFFRKHQDEFARDHHGQYVLIHDETADGFFDFELDAFSDGKKKWGVGNFLIRHCVRPDEETAQVFHSRVAI